MLLLRVFFLMNNKIKILLFTFVIIGYLIFNALSSDKVKSENLFICAKNAVAAKNYSEAEKYYRQAINNCDSNECRSKVSYMLSFSQLLFYENRFSEAERILAAALDISIISIGEKSQETLDICREISYQYLQRHHLGEAQRYAEFALRIAKANDKFSSSICKVCDVLGSVYVEQGRYSQAEELYLAALKVKDDCSVSGMEYLAVLLGDLADLYRQIGKYSESEILFEKALDTLPQSSMNTRYKAVILSNYGLLLHTSGSIEKAIVKNDQALECCTEFDGESSFIAGRIYRDLAGCYSSLGDFEEAEGLYNKSIEIFNQIYGRPQMPETALANVFLTACYHKQGKFQEGLELINKVLPVVEDAYGENHVNTAMAYLNLGVLYREVGMSAEAEAAILKAINIKKSVYGINNQNIALDYMNLGVVYSETEIDKAEDCFNKAYSILNENMQTDSYMYAVVLNNLGEMRMKKGDAGNALLFFQQSLQLLEKKYQQERSMIDMVKERLQELSVK